MKLKSKNLYLPLFGVFLLLFAGCGPSKNTSENLVSDSVDAKATIIAKHPKMAELFSTSKGYAIFPNVGKGAYVIGGASGNGTVYENGRMVGYADLKQVDIGFQIGGKAFIEVLFFQTQTALDDFKDGSFQLSGNISAVILEEGASKDVEFNNGIAVVTMPKAGAMAGISVGGQRFEFFPTN
ncbi:YSC84-related protein [Gillisia sp. Q332]|uniref:lipid-binding SYLF domain-containing protein n=1 Tax=Gillisia xinjiangensis TaxID=3384765 RepID=UPI00391C95D0